MIPAANAEQETPEKPSFMWHIIILSLQKKTGRKGRKTVPWLIKIIFMRLSSPPLPSLFLVNLPLSHALTFRASYWEIFRSPESGVCPGGRLYFIAPVDIFILNLMKFFTLCCQPQSLGKWSWGMSSGHLIVVVPWPTMQVEKTESAHPTSSRNWVLCISSCTSTLAFWGWMTCLLKGIAHIVGSSTVVCRDLGNLPLLR